ncbi:MAG TPA: Fe-S protein assembly co-chaperone HscB [Polyangia bacterium]|jgi:Fe-S protein assembly co-chaperone HscB|nr:Fe-S protein assembly co-chaperone HscB [Polyangia bacterium]
MICWSCEKNAGDGMLCVGCGAVQPPDRTADHFRVFGLPRKFDLDMADLERRYKEMTKVLHPDHFARADGRARRASLERSVQLNLAWSTLSEPVPRAEYLLSLQGIEVGEYASSKKSGEIDNRATQPVDTALLIEVMDLREALAGARSRGDGATVARLVADAQTHHDKEMEEVAAGFAAAKPDLAAIAARMVAARYYRRFLEEAEADRDSEHGTAK